MDVANQWPALPTQHPDTYPECGCRDLPEHILYLQASLLRQAYEAQHRDLNDYARQINELDGALEDEITTRDHYHELLDQFAYAVAPQDVIGEHSSGNCPWQNALEILVARPAR
jgi:hypothetical protein